MLIDGFNVACKSIATSCIKVGDESMSEIRFRTTAKGKLPHLFYIFRKLYPQGIDFKTVAFSINKGLDINLSTKREVKDESKQVPEGAWRNFSLY